MATLPQRIPNKQNHQQVFMMACRIPLLHVPHVLVPIKICPLSVAHILIDGLQARPSCVPNTPPTQKRMYHTHPLLDILIRRNYWTTMG
jgi:hypothetical protein